MSQHDRLHTQMAQKVPPALTLALTCWISKCCYDMYLSWSSTACEVKTCFPAAILPSLSNSLQSSVFGRLQCSCCIVSLMLGDRIRLSSHNIDSVATVSHWPFGAQWCHPGQEGQRWQLAHPAVARSQPLSATADSPLNPEALNFTQIGKSHITLR